MSYLFSDEGILSGFYNDKDNRVFVLQGLRSCLSAEVVAKAITRMCPAAISGCRVLLTLTEPQMRDLASTIFSESSHNAQESEGIMRVIRNRAVRKSAMYGSVGFWSQIGGGGIDGRKTGNYAMANGKTLETWKGTMLTDLQATVRGLVKPADITNGAYFWIATSIKNGSNLFGNGLRAKPPDFLVTAEYGLTTFLSYNPASLTYGKKVWP